MTKAEGVRKRRLGRTGQMVSEIGLGGAFLLGRDGSMPFPTGIEVVRQALELGVTFFDTAECYIHGRSEEVLGAGLEGWMGDCVVATKLGHRPSDFDFSRASALASAQESRRLLGRTIDVLQIHTPAVPPWERLFGPGGTVEGMREARDKGVCRYLGITGNDIDFMRRCIETDVFDTILTFLCYDLLDQSGASLLAEARAHDMGVILASPLRMGLLGAYAEEMEQRATESQKRRLADLRALFASEPGGLVAGAIRFALAPEEVSVVLSGSSSPQQIEEVVEVAATPLRPDLAQAVRDIAAKGDKA